MVNKHYSKPKGCLVTLRKDLAGVLSCYPDWVGILNREQGYHLRVDDNYFEAQLQ
jgi:hypothetical protein